MTELGEVPMKIQALTLIFLLAVTTGARAQTRYVSDELVITLRSGPSTRNQIIENLTSGAQVEVLEELPEEGYTRVRLGDGTEGWVISRYLVAERIAADRLVAAERDLASATQRIVELEGRVSELSDELGQSRAQVASTSSTNEEISKELDDIRTASANAIALRDQNQSLRERASGLSVQVDQLQMANAELRSRSRQNWFVVGAAVLFGGVIIGLIAPSLRPRRKSSW